MKKYIAVGVALAASAIMLLAADIDGKWVNERQGKNGPQTTTLTLKSDGSKLTGTMDNGRGGPTEIKEGTVNGANVSFKVVRDFQGKSNEQTYKGTVAGSELKLTVEGGGGGKGGGGGEQVYKKQ
jgi:hypothetical protein